MKEIELIHEIKIPSRTPITTKMVWETFKVIHTFEETEALDTFNFLICEYPTIWVVRIDTAVEELWEVRRGLITIDVQYIEEIEWIVSTLKQSYRKRYEVEPEKFAKSPNWQELYKQTHLAENQNLYRDRYNLDE